jgi:hypothetical protein
MTIIIVIGGMNIAISAFDGSLSHYKYQKKMIKKSSSRKEKLDVCFSDEFEFSLMHSTPAMLSDDET